MSSTFDRVKKIAVDHLEVEPDKVIGEAHFINDLGADSLDNVELIIAFEEEFDLEIRDDVAEGIQTINDAVRVVEELQAA